MRFTGTGPRRRAAINLTPLIDVLFLLVIFVLVTARFEDVGAVEVDLPRGTSESLPARQTLTLSVTSAGAYYLGEEEVPQASLRDVLQRRAAEARETGLVIRADRSVPWEAVHFATEAAKEAGLRRVAFQSEQ
jgi:biopolymer transport protein ExbD